MHSLEQAAGSIGLYVNANNTEFMCFKQEAISTLRDKPLELADQFTYLGNNISSTESDVNIRLLKARENAFERLLIIWKSDFSDKRKPDFFQAVTVSILLYGCTTLTLT